LKRVEDGQQHPFHILQHIVIPETDDAVSLAFEKLRAGRVPRCGGVMLSTVHLDGEPGFPAQKIADEGPDGHLPAELPAVQLPPAEVPPQPFLGIGEVPPKLLRPRRRSRPEEDLPGAVSVTLPSRLREGIEGWGSPVRHGGYS
jgi:hypothetical protein